MTGDATAPQAWATAPGSAVGLTGAAFALQVLPAGGLVLTVAGQAYLLESFLSAPGPRLGLNALAATAQGESAWQPRVQRLSPHHLRLEAAGAAYRLVRSLTVQGARLLVADIISNDGPEDLGLWVSHRLQAAGPVRDARIGGGPPPGADPAAPMRPVVVGPAGAAHWSQAPSRHLCAENPTLFCAQANSALGVVGEDSVTRLQFCGSLTDDQPQFVLPRLGLAARTTRALRWAVYPQPGPVAYFDFINQVRRDWGTNFRLDGPWGFFDVGHHQALLDDPAALARYLQRKQLAQVALMPWLDYDNYDAGQRRLLDRRAYAPRMQAAARALRAARPGLQCLGCIEGNIVGLPPAAVEALYELLPPDQRQRGYPRSFSPTQEQLLRQLALPWQDCLYTGPDGHHAYELYYRGAAYDPVGDLQEQDRHRVPMMGLMVYAAPGNDQLAWWLDQAQFLLDEVGLDGVYIDQFSLAFTELQRYSWHGWDGLTVELDPATGTIARRCVDGAWVGIGARQQLIEYVRSRGKTLVANSAAAAEELQALPVARFMEAEFALGTAAWEAGQPPPLAFYPCKGHLGSPLALGSRPELAQAPHYARHIMRTAVAYLRHGLLFYHYLTEIPTTGPGAGDYGALNRMFPCTPVALHEGWVEGLERVVTTRSGRFRWTAAAAPQVEVFDVEGRPAPARAGVTRDSAGWQVELELADWQEIGVITAGGSA